MIPFYFGSDERRLFGIYEAPRRAPTRHAAVLCHPWGPEYIHAYRAMRQLAKMLTAKGIHTLRFDYYGTGDSAGDTVAAEMDGWEADIQSAIEELRDTADTPRVSLVGLRLGAALAAKVAVRTDVAIESLVLWDPVANGAEYLAELHQGARFGRSGGKRAATRPANDGGGHEIMGFPLTDPMTTAMKAIDLAGLAPELPERTLIVASQPAMSHTPFQYALERRPSGALAIEHVASEPGWVEWPIGHPMAGTVPVKVLQKIVEWLG
jgi:uncharacterized protein